MTMNTTRRCFRQFQSIRLCSYYSQEKKLTTIKALIQRKLNQSYCIFVALMW